MRNSAQGQPLQSLAFEWHELPLVVDLGNTESAHQAFEAAQRELNNAQDRAAQQLAGEEK